MFLTAKVHLLMRETRWSYLYTATFKLEAFQISGMDLSEWVPWKAAPMIHERLGLDIYDLSEAVLTI